MQRGKCISVSWRFPMHNAPFMWTVMEGGGDLIGVILNLVKEHGLILQLAYATIEYYYATIEYYYATIEYYYATIEYYIKLCNYI